MRADSYKKHTSYGYDILKDQIGYKESIYRPAREHHETMDGLVIR